MQLKRYVVVVSDPDSDFNFDFEILCCDLKRIGNSTLKIDDSIIALNNNIIEITEIDINEL